MRQSILAIATTCLIAPSTFAATDHAETPMMAAPVKPVTSEDRRIEAEAGERSEPSDAIIARFRQAYPASQPLSAAIFWNRKFNGQVSDWMSSRRSVVISAGSLTGKIPDGDVTLQGEGTAAAQVEYRSAHANSGQAPAFEIQAGFIRQLQQAGARPMDRNALMRLTDNALEDGTFSRLSPDNSRLEMHALAKHADLMIQLEGSGVSGYRITVIDIKSGEIRTMVSASGLPPESEHPGRWVTSSTGFEKQREPITLEDVGQELALQTLQALAP